LNKLKEILLKILNIVLRFFGTFFSVFFKTFGTVLLIGIVTVCLFACIFIFYVNNYLSNSIDVDLNDYNLDLTSIIYYYDDAGNPQELYKLSKEENRIWVEYSEIPTDLIYAAVAIEDKRFFTHTGVDWTRTGFAVVNMFFSMKNSFGGSTITQQLIKNLTGDKATTVSRKVQEIFRALEFEQKYSKEIILEWYLNTIYLGEGCNGVKTAAQVYFGKDLSELNLAECASLIGITNNPSLYDPFLSLSNNKYRQEIILEEMYNQGIISLDEYNEAVAYELKFSRDSVGSSMSSTTSYYVDQVITDVLADLQEQMGVTEKTAYKMLYTGGYSIYCCMDEKVQSTMESVFENLENYPAFVNGDIPETAMVIMDPNTGNVLGIIGGKGEKTASRILNRATGTVRAPGSSIKPLSVYIPALEGEYINPYSVMTDSPAVIYENGIMWPKNQNTRYIGQMTIDRAVRLSTNTVAVKLLQQIGLDTSWKYLTTNFGFNTLESADLNLAPLALGGMTHGVSVLDLTAAYCSIANGGTYYEPRTYYSVVDSKGNTILSTHQATWDAMEEDSAYYMNQMLTSVIENGTATSARISGQRIAGKTGTTTNDNDRWFAGYSAYYCGVCWFGYDIQREIQLSKSTNPCVIMWKQVMQELHSGLEKKEFPVPNIEQTKVTLCDDCGLLATELCEIDIRGERTTSVYLFTDDIPTESCNCHIEAFLDTSTGKIATPFCPEYLLRRVSMLNFDRLFVVEDLTLINDPKNEENTVDKLIIEDEGYVYRMYGELLPEGTYRAKGNTSYNEYCTLHVTPVMTP